ncbi:uncharacterized protein LOC143294932 [Babylonia areolata]|uniref:uncharacterized protein LOC143294932 n=1 Tax=Babylonia areolata TaxID=304850 RepID=UPI003FD1BDE7
MSKAGRRVRVMPAIREESNMRTNRIPVHIIPPGSGPQAPLQSSMIIQNLPDPPRDPPPKVTPSNRYHDNVEQVVADYLHFSRYGQVLPVSHGFAPLACPCCADRNRENVKRMKDRSRAPPPDPDPDTLPPPLSDPELPSSSSSANIRRTEGEDVLDPRLARGPAGRDDPRNFPASWMDYQPVPYAQTYLNSEFNRAAALRSYQEDRKQYDDASMAYVSGRVLDASSKYDLAMKKLERSLHNFSDDSRELSDLSYQ